MNEENIPENDPQVRREERMDVQPASPLGAPPSAQGLQLAPQYGPAEERMDMQPEPEPKAAAAMSPSQSAYIRQYGMKPLPPALGGQPGDYYDPAALGGSGPYTSEQIQNARRSVPEVGFFSSGAGGGVQQAPGSMYATHVWNGPRHSQTNFVYGEGGQVAGSFDPQDPKSLYVADPTTQWRVQQLEKAKDVNNNSTDISPEVKQQLAAKKDAEIDALDPHKIFRKGGLLSMQTPGEKAFAQNTARDPKTGAMLYIDPKGVPHVVAKGLEPGAMEEHKNKMEFEALKHKHMIEEHQAKLKQDHEHFMAKMEKDKADAREKLKLREQGLNDRAKQRNDAEFERQIKRRDQVRKEILGRNKPVSEEDIVAEIDQRTGRENTAAKANVIAHEASEAVSHFGEGLTAMQEMQAATMYKHLHSDKAGARSHHEIQERWLKALAKMREKASSQAAEGPTLPPHPAAQNLTGIPDAAAVISDSPPAPPKPQKPKPFITDYQGST